MRDAGDHAHPSDEKIASFVEGRLSSEEAQQIALHLADCEACVAVVAAVAAHERDASRRKAVWRWMFIAAVLFVTVCGIAVVRRQSGRDPIARLADAFEGVDVRPVEPRLTGLPYRPQDSLTRGRDDRPSSVRRLRLRAADLAVDGRDAPEHLRGLAFLVAGDSAEAVRILERAAEAEVSDPRIHSDLAAARYARGREENDPRELVRALAATDDALAIDIHLDSALFNRALTLEALHLAGPAVSAYQRYLLVDSTSPWATEVRTRLGSLRGRRRTDDWEMARGAIEQAVETRDAARVATLVAAFSQESRTWGEVIYLNDWAVAVESNDHARAEKSLAVAREIGRALERRRGEQLLAQSVAAIERAEEPLVLAQAYRAYFQARLNYTAREVASALPRFDDAIAGFGASGSPMALVATYYRALCLDDLDRVVEASRTLDALASRLEKGHRALRAQVDWQYGTERARAGLLNEALTSQQQALAAFENLGERANASLMRNAIAGTMAALGRAAESWRIRADLFRSLSDAGDLRAMQTALELAARTEALANRWDSAHALLAIAVWPPLRINQRLVVDSFLWSALSADRMGKMKAAEEDLRSARSAILKLQDARLRAQAEMNASFVQARMIRTTRPRDAIALLDEVIASMTEAQNLFLLPEALLERAASFRMIGEDTAAVKDLRLALQTIDRRRGAPGDSFRDTYFATADAASEMLVDLLDRHGRPLETLAVTDAAKSRSIADHVRQASFPSRDDAWWQELPAGITVVEYQTLEDRLLIFAARRSGVEARSAPIPRRKLRADVATLVSAPDSTAGRRAAEHLYDALIAPIFDSYASDDTLVVVPDKILLGLPFAALRDSKRTRYLIEDVGVVVAPNAALYIHALQTRILRDDASPLLAVGDPAFDRERFRSLRRLPGAEREIEAAAAKYGAVQKLRDVDATRRAVLGPLENASIVHIAAHAIAVPRDPGNSFLVLAPSADDTGALYAHEIAKLRVRRDQLVILAGCRTASQAEADSDLQSLALSFLAAGASTVLGTAWDAEDEASLRFTEGFHDFLRAGLEPAAAARQAQLQMMHAPDPALRAVQAWGAFQVVGSGR